MYKKYKKFFSCVLVMAICFTLVLPTMAAEQHLWVSDEQMASIGDALVGVEAQKTQLGLEEIDFTELCVGVPIQTYLYVNGVFEADRVMYPIISDNQLIFWAIEENGKFQITTALVKQINQIIEPNQPFALVYDRNSCYLYADDSFTLLYCSDMEVECRSVLNPDAALPEYELETASFSENSTLEYRGNIAREPVYYGCPVGFVGQSPYKSLCWAAVVASIVNYCKGKSLTAESVAKAYYGDSSDYDMGIYPNEAPGIFYDYGLIYVYQSTPPSENTILANIQSDYPLYGRWAHSGGYHATVIYGINVSGGYIYIMDPEIGFTSASVNSSGKYTYVAGLNTTLTLVGAVRYKK